MKKILLTAVAALAAFAAHGAEWKTHSFLGVPSLVVSNKTLGITNLSYVTGGTNYTGVIFTNNNNTRIIVGTTTNANGTYAGTTTPLIGTVPISPLVSTIVPVINANPFTNSSPLKLTVRAICGSGANASGGLVLQVRPVFGIDSQGNPKFAGTGSGYQVPFAFTPVASTTVVLSTNIPVHGAFAGATGILLESLDSTDTDASSDMTITDLEVTQPW